MIITALYTYFVMLKITNNDIINKTTTVYKRAVELSLIRVTLRDVSHNIDLGTRNSEGARLSEWNETNTYELRIQTQPTKRTKWAVVDSANAVFGVRVLD